MVIVKLEICVNFSGEMTKTREQLIALRYIIRKVGNRMYIKGKKNNDNVKNIQYSNTRKTGCTYIRYIIRGGSFVICKVVRKYVFMKDYLKKFI